MSNDMKRLTAPRSWPVPRKTNYWIAKPSPGPHGIEGSMPLVVVLRDMLSVADTAIEVKRILGKREVLVDGRVARLARRRETFRDLVRGESSRPPGRPFPAGRRIG